MAETALAFGLFSGPAIGFFTYTYSGYTGTFLIFGGILTAVLIVTIICFPRTIDNYAEEDVEEVNL